MLTGGLSFAGLLRLNGVRSAAKGRVDRCPARATAAVSAADPTFRPEYSAYSVRWRFGTISLKDHETFCPDFAGALYSDSQHSTKQPESQLKSEKFLKRKMKRTEKLT